MIQTKQTLRQRLGTGIVLTAAGIAGLIGAGGCEFNPGGANSNPKCINWNPAQNTDISGTSAQNMAISGASAQYVATTSPNLTYQQSQTLGAVGGLLGILAQQEAMKEAAREVRSEVIINANPPQNNLGVSSQNAIISPNIYFVENMETGEVFYSDEPGFKTAEKTFPSKKGYAYGWIIGKKRYRAGWTKGDNADRAFEAYNRYYNENLDEVVNLNR